MPIVAGVDSSTQSCKVLIVDADSGEILRQGRSAHPSGTEVNPDFWWSALCEAITEAGGLTDVSAISIAGQQHGLVALDPAGRVVRDALLWNDTRSASSADDLIAEVGAKDYSSRTGLVPVASFTATKLRWVRDNEPQNVERIAAVCLPHDWLTWRLRGYGPEGESPLGPRLDELITDRSDSSGTGYWSPTSGQYDLDLFRIALGRSAIQAAITQNPRVTSPRDEVLLPRVLNPNESVSVAAENPRLVGLQPGTLVAAGAGDNAAAMFGLGGVSGDVVISIGTSGTVFAVSDKPITDQTGVVAGFADAAGKYLPLVATLNAARVLEASSMLLDVDLETLAELALSAPSGAGGLTLLPYFEGERTPNLPKAKAALIGMTLSNASKQNLARAAFEGMICALADGLSAITSLGLKPKRLLLIGGGAKSKAVPPIASEIMGLPVWVPEFAEYVALGAARQAAWALTGALPQWTLKISQRADIPGNPGILDTYHQAFHRQVWQ